LTDGRPTPAIPRGWSIKDLERLAVVAEAFAGGDPHRRAALIADSIARVADPSDQRLLRLALRTFDSRLLNRLLGLGAVRLRDLDQHGRDAYLMAWATSRLARRRSTFQVLKRLSLFFAYADPGADGQGNPHWGAMGYGPLRVPVEPGPPAVRPVPVDGPTILEADVVVVGSGAGGGVVAQELAKRGRSVVVVEAGPFIRETEMPLTEIDGLDRMYLEHGLLTTDDAGVVMFSGSVLGGGTTVNWASCFAPPDWLRTEWAREHGIDGFEGGEGEADLLALREELAFAEPPLIPPKDQVILRGAAALGWDAGPMERDAVACGDCGSCSFGCRRGAKRSGPVLHLAEATRNGARILVDATVERILLGGGRAIGVEAVTSDGQALTVRAPSVVVAAGALRTPAILRLSGLEHPAIGRYLRIHPVPVVIGRYGQPIEMWRGTTQGASSRHFVGPGRPGGGPGGFIIESAPAHVGVAASLLPWEGRVANEAMLGDLRYVAPLIAICRDLDGGSVTVRRNGTVRIGYRLSDRDGATVRAAVGAMAQMHRAANALEITVLATPAPRSYAGDHFEGFLRRLARLDMAPNRLLIASAHQMGTARMGADPTDHVCDPRGRVRADVQGTLVEGLFVADGSLFPTASGVNPMVTIMALARRVARTVASQP
jgi:choline dehydrogenase-like flavoprotein